MRNPAGVVALAGLFLFVMHHERLVQKTLSILSFAQRPAQLRMQLQSNEHAPAKFRTNGPLADVPAFAQAFACKAGDAMRRPESDIVEIW